MRSSYATPLATLGLAASLITQTSAFFRMSCPSRLVAERVDPIISPGVTSGHVHTVSGGNGFDFLTSYEQQIGSTCSSCPVKADKSAYWTPQLYFQDPKTNVLEIVPQSGSSAGSSGGMTIYYQQRPGKGEKIYAFPEGFRMVAGNPFQRTKINDTAAPGLAVSFACLNYDIKATNETQELPRKYCPDGLRAQVYFPSCWNDKDLDSPDHSSHMSYPIGAYDNGPCPADFPKHLISLFYEVPYDTARFSDRWDPDVDEQPFVFAMGDKTGYGFHGDFINGWNVDTLQTVADKCNSDTGNISDCPPIADDLYTVDESQACKIPPRINERINGTDDEPMMELPGCNPITGNFSVVTPQTNCPNTPTPGPYKTYYTDVTSSLGWAYAGCAQDGISKRTLAADFTWSFNMSVEYCVNYCKGKGYSLAGLEYADQCYCDNDYSNPELAPDATVLGNCWQPCAGDSSQVCGGAAALSVYRSCDDGSCNNAAYVNPYASDAFTVGDSASSNNTEVDTASESDGSSSSSALPGATSDTSVSSGSSVATSVNSLARKQRASTTLVSSVSSSSSSELSSTTTEVPSLFTTASSFTSLSLSTISNDGAAVVTVTHVVTATTQATVYASLSHERKHNHFLKHRRSNH